MPRREPAVQLVPSIAMPATFRQRLTDLLAIGRVPNLPTVWSNVLLGVLLGFTIPLHRFGYSSSQPTPLLFEVTLAIFAVSCAYLCGTFLNDWKDAEFDRQHRPERAIPSNRFSRGSILLFALSFGALALLSLAILSLPALLCGILLLASILLYTRIHKRTPLAIIPMGLCRTCLYLIGFLVVTSRLDFWTSLPADFLTPSRLMADPVPAHVLIHLATMGLGILVYIAGLTLAARYENRPEGLKAPRVLIWFLIFFPLLTHTWWWIFRAPPFLEGWHLAIPALLGLVPFLLWTVRALFVLRRSIPDFVSRALAGLCLLDLLAFPGLAATVATPWPVINAYPLVLACVPLSLFPLALVLQRFAPAT